MRFDELKNDLVATVAHEFRTPLTSLRMAIHLCAEERRRAAHREAGGPHVRGARRTASGCSRIVDDLLDLSRIQSGRLALSWGAAAPSASSSRPCCDEHRSEANAADVALVRVGAASTCPRSASTGSASSSCSRTWSRTRSSTRPRGGSVEVTRGRGRRVASGSRSRTRERASPPEHHERIFEKFFRVPGATGGRGRARALSRPGDRRGARRPDRRGERSGAGQPVLVHRASRRRRARRRRPQRRRPLERRSPPPLLALAPQGRRVDAEDARRLLHRRGAAPCTRRMCSRSISSSGEVAAQHGGVARAGRDALGEALRLEHLRRAPG